MAAFCAQQVEREELRLGWWEEEDLTIYSVRNSDIITILHRQQPTTGIKYEIFIVCHYMVIFFVLFQICYKVSKNLPNHLYISININF